MTDKYIFIFSKCVLGN